MNTQKTFNSWQEATTYLCGRLENIEFATQINRADANFSINSLRETINEIGEAVYKIEDSLIVRELQKKEWLNISELCEYLPDKPALPTVYGWVGQRQIPFRKNGKKLRFLRSEIDKWLLNGNMEKV